MGTGDRDAFRVLFDEDPVAYDRTRPVAPDPVFDEVVVLATQSAIKTLPVEARRELLSRVRRRVMALGGSLTVHHLAVTTIAKRR